ncbi:hypothetical protein ON010_g18062 [Phytophthora cinnamomi]|nr:hypothetical protein ON010_g18062 [Phytophthora cinnamomi]
MLRAQHVLTKLCLWAGQRRVDGGDGGGRQPRGGLADRALPARAVLRPGVHAAVAPALLGQARVLRGAPLRDARPQGRVRERHRAGQELGAGPAEPRADRGQAAGAAGGRGGQAAHARGRRGLDREQRRLQQDAARRGAALQ